jgi:hypothetical protein
MTKINNNRVVCRPDNGLVILPALLPDTRRFIALYGALIKPGEIMTLQQFAERISLAGGCKAQSFDFVPTQADRDAFHLRSWIELALYTEDSVVNFSALPIEFFFIQDDIEYEYTYDDCIALLGPAAVGYFQSEIVAMEKEGA